jgi:hypothetical protein
MPGRWWPICERNRMVAMSEQVTDCLVLTLDYDDFSTYRRHEREVIPFLSPRR